MTSSFDDAWAKVEGRTYQGGQLQEKEELRQLFHMIREAECEDYLEVGSRRGDSWYVLSHALPKGATTIAVDWPNAHWGDAESPIHLYQTAGELWRSGYYPHVILGNSHNVHTRSRVSHILHTTADAVFIDGDHTYEGVESDYYHYKGEKLTALHDIYAPGDGNIETPAFWEQLTNPHKTAIGHPNGGLGIGVVR